jgi:hypothetical protein
MAQLWFGQMDWTYVRIHYTKWAQRCKRPLKQQRINMENDRKWVNIKFYFSFRR